MLIASAITAAFFVAGVSAWHPRKRRHPAFAYRGFAIAVWSAAVLTSTQILVGDLHGLNTKEHQPLKVAAMEGRWETMSGAPLVLFAVPDQEGERNRFEIGIPNGASIILEHDPEGIVYGLTAVPPEERPNEPVVFYSFRVMVGLGLLMLVLSWMGAWRLRHGRLADSGLYLRIMVAMMPSGFVATSPAGTSPRPDDSPG